MLGWCAIASFAFSAVFHVTRTSVFGIRRAWFFDEIGFVLLLAGIQLGHTIAAYGGGANDDAYGLYLWLNIGVAALLVLIFGFFVGDPFAHENVIVSLLHVAQFATGIISIYYEENSAGVMASMWIVYACLGGAIVVQFTDLPKRARSRPCDRRSRPSASSSSPTSSARTISSTTRASARRSSASSSSWPSTREVAWHSHSHSHRHRRRCRWRGQKAATPGRSDE